MNAMKKLICLLLMLCAGTAAFAWGGREHRLIAYIAEAHLTPRTRQVLDRYLDQSIVEYSTWMDRYRTAPGYEITTYWHMVTIDKDGSVPPEPLRPNGDGDAVRQLTRAIERLRNYRELSDSTVNVNLKYVIHLVGEMHCPGHIYFADLPGGMDAPRHYDFFLLKYKGKEVTYHWVWDGSVSRQYPDWTEEDFRRELDKWPAEKQRAVGEGTPADWALECARSCRVVYDWAKPGDDIDEGFLREHGALPVDQALLERGEGFRPRDRHRIRPPCLITGEQDGALRDAELEPLDVVQVFDGLAGIGNVAVVGIGPAEDAEATFPNGVPVEQVVGGAGGGPDDVVHVVKKVGHGEDAEFLHERDRIGDAHNGDVEIPGAHVLDHFRFVAELAGGEELDFHLAFGPGFHDFLEPGADGPHLGIDGIAHAHFQDGFLISAGGEGAGEKGKRHHGGKQAFEHRILSLSI